MSITRVAGADRGAGFVATIRPVLPDLLFVLLAVYNAIRLFRHAMWRDELQAFMVAAASNTPLDLFAKLKYEGHPGLWHLLLWVVTRFTTDPVAMQVLHLVIALGVWVLVWRLSPFRPVGKLLLLLSYYLFWEYFVVSRGYALGCCSASALRRCKRAAPSSASGHGCCSACSPTPRCLEPSGRSASDCSTRCAIAKSGGSCCPVWRSTPRLRPLPS